MLLNESYDFYQCVCGSKEKQYSRDSLDILCLKCGKKLEKESREVRADRLITEMEKNVEEWREENPIKAKVVYEFAYLFNMFLSMLFTLILMTTLLYLFGF